MIGLLGSKSVQGGPTSAKSQLLGDFGDGVRASGGRVQSVAREELVQADLLVERQDEDTVALASAKPQARAQDRADPAVRGARLVVGFKALLVASW